MIFLLFAAFVGLAGLFWEGVLLSFWFGWLLLTGLAHLIGWAWRRLDRDPADRPEWWAAKLADHPEGGWLT